MKLPVLRALDWSLIIAPLLLVGVGIATIYSTTLGTAQMHLARDQAIFALIGIVAMAAFTIYDYRNLRNASVFLYIISVILLVVVLFFGVKVFGATRWINLGFTQFQPSELLKVSLILFISSFLAQGITKWWKRLVWLILLTAVPVGLVLYQPDLGTAIVIGVIFLSLFFSWPISNKVKIVAAVLILAMIPVGWMSIHDYQRERIYTFISPERDPYGSGYNVIQSKIAVGSGGIWGRGLGNGPQSQLNFLPVAHTDFVFAGWAEATGFAGAVGLIVVMGVLNWRIYHVAAVAKDAYGKYLAIGFGAMITVQAAVNIGMNIGLAPVTGIPLPFVSYGGTALLINFIMLGIMQSIYIRHKKMSFE